MTIAAQRPDRSRREALLARFAWALAVGAMGQAGAGFVVFLVAVVGGAISGDWPISTGVALVGISEAGFAVGLGLVAVRPSCDVAGYSGRWFLAALVAGMSLPIVLGAAFGSAVDVSSWGIVVLVLRTLIGTLLAVDELFVGRLGIARPWHSGSRVALMVAVAMTVWLLFTLARLDVASVPLAGLLLVWVVALVAMAMGASRFYTMDGDLSAGPGWRLLAVAAGCAGVVLAVFVVGVGSGL